MNMLYGFMPSETNENKQSLFLFSGVIVGSSQDETYDECINHVLKYKDNLSGVLLAGITDGTEQSLTVPIKQLEEIFKKVNVSKSIRIWYDHSFLNWLYSIQS